MMEEESRQRHHEAERREIKPFLNFPWLAFAHRGGAGERVESTWAAFENAVELGYTHIEIDVRATKDGVVVVFHDKNLSRLTGLKGSISDYTWEEVSEIEIEGGQRIVRLDELLEKYPEIYFNIDPKEDNVVQPLIRVLREAKAIDRVCVGSFSDKRLETIREALGPNLATALGPLDAFKLKIAAKFDLKRNLGLKGDCVQVPIKLGITVVDNQFVLKAHELGLKVIVWTVNDPEEMTRLIDLGVDGIMTDDITALREILVEQKLWNSGDT